MSYPVLYGSKETDFANNGIGVLSSCISCNVTETTSGIFELSIQYPTDGIHFSEIDTGSIIKAKCSRDKKQQLFRVYFIDKTMSRVSKIFARHISYDLSGVPVAKFSIYNVSGSKKLTPNVVFNAIKENAVTSIPFVFSSDIVSEIESYVSKSPMYFRSHLLGEETSLLQKFGGEIEFDNFSIILHKKRGKNNGASVRYGKNLINAKQEKNCANVSTGVYPFWSKISDNNIQYAELPEKVVYADGQFAFQNIEILDLSSFFEEKPSESALRVAAKTYMQKNGFGKPTVSLIVSFSQVEQYEKLGYFDNFAEIGLYDTVSVFFPAMNVLSESIVSKIVYDSIHERIESVTLGEMIANVADTIADQKKEIEKLKGKK